MTASTPQSVRSSRKILVVLNRPIGDSILILPFVRNLRLNFPVAQIDVITFGAFTTMMKQCPYVDNVIQEQSFGQLFWHLLKNQYDLAFVYRQSVKNHLMCKLSGIPTVVSHAFVKWPKPIGRRNSRGLVDLTPPQPANHGVLDALTFLDACNLQIHNDYLEVWNTLEDEQAIIGILNNHNITEDKPIAIIHGYTYNRTKALDIRCFQKTLQLLHGYGYQVICTGEHQGKPLYDQLSREAETPITNLAGETTLGEMIALYRKAAFLVSVDSAPIHIAAAVGIPHIIGIYLPQNPVDYWRPYNPACRFIPIHDTKNPNPCILSHEMGEAVGQLLASQPSPTTS